MSVCMWVVEHVLKGTSNFRKKSKEEGRFLVYLFSKFFWGRNMEQKTYISVIYQTEANPRTYACKYHLKLVKQNLYLLFT